MCPLFMGEAGAVTTWVGGLARDGLDIKKCVIEKVPLISQSYLTV